MDKKRLRQQKNFPLLFFVVGFKMRKIRIREKHPG
jgi:hypothetical protein